MTLSLGLGLGLTQRGRGIPSWPALSGAITAWNQQQADERVLYAGRAVFTRSASITGGTLLAGRTFMMNYVKESMLQNGFVRSIEVDASKQGQGMKFKLFRPGSDNNYTMIAETELFYPVTSETFQTFVPLNPLGPCQPGDRIGCWLSGSPTQAAVYVTADSSASARWVDGDATSLSANIGESTQLASTSINIRFMGTPPFLIGTGDSIMEGHNSANVYHSWRHGGPSGNIDAEIMHRMRALVPSLEYQNYALGSTTWTGALAVASLIAEKKPRAVLVQCGVNDIGQSRTWEAMEADMDAFLAAMAPETHVFVDEILPWTAGNDANAATLRSYNENYAAWCQANGVTLLTAHDPMAQIRPSTGELDNIKSEYDYGGVHYTVPAGVNALAKIFVDQMNTYPW